LQVQIDLSGLVHPEVRFLHRFLKGLYFLLDLRLLPYLKSLWVLSDLWTLSALYFQWVQSHLYQQLFQCFLLDLFLQWIQYFLSTLSNL
jgi:hypothetical protein